MICPSCHTANREDAKFCKGCGQPLKSLDAAQQVQEVQEAREAQGTQGIQETPQAVATQAPEQSASEAASPEVLDPSLEPTLILSPEKMVAYRARRWNAEAQRQSPPDEFVNGNSNWSDAPTVLSAQTPSAEEAQPSVADMPTVLMPPSQGGETPSIAPPPPPESLAAPAPSGKSEPGEAGEEEAAAVQNAPAYHRDNGGYPEVGTGENMQQSQEPVEQGEPAPTVQPTGAASAASPGETGAPVEAGEASEAGEAEEAQQPAEEVTSDFPVLAVGTLLIGRYEVTQVISDDPQEHVYQVVDHQGYQRCWNCHSEQNAEGDEFCIECGASLLNAPYTLHEYSPQQSPEDSPVLQGNIVNTFVDQGKTYAIEQVLPEQSAFPNGVSLEVATASDAGDVRRSDPNEDSTLVLHFQRIHESISLPLGVFIVADGMGGHDNGQGASRMTINIIAERMVRELLLAPLTAEKNGEPVKPLDEDALIALLQGAVEDANNALCQKNAQEKSDMGSTVTGVMVVGEHAYIVNVGDSRTYMVRGKQLYQMTTDHSLVAQLVASGLIEPDDVYTHPQRSQIFRSLGDKPSLQIDIFKQQLHPGDILLSCCDGLWEMVRNPQIESILNAAPDPQTACAQLIEAANAGGGEDNISAVVVFVR
jgi:serine/threonine protein phosphatase PrpC/rRNA maturation endonuclease Nob1